MEVDKTRSLDELEKSLQAASNSIIATKPACFLFIIKTIYWLTFSANFFCHQFDQHL
jgi:hypothetical protein